MEQQVESIEERSMFVVHKEEKEASVSGAIWVSILWWVLLSSLHKL